MNVISYHNTLLKYFNSKTRNTLNVKVLIDADGGKPHLLLCSKDWKTQVSIIKMLQIYIKNLELSFQRTHGATMSIIFIICTSY